ncbi:MAG: ABC transporter ATP-binding protein [bacterium]
MISVRDVRKRFETPAGPVDAVAGISLEIPEKSFVAIVGKSGSGKSTLLSLLGALDSPTSGTVTIDGVDITKLGAGGLRKVRCEKVGFVFQAYNLVPNMTAIQNVMLPMEFAGLAPGRRVKRAKIMLDLVGLDADKHDKRPGKLSGGEQQRVAIARALANKPKLILADEPTGNLDSETGKRIIDLMKRLARSEDMTVIAVTHDTAMAQQADRSYTMADGRLQGDATTAAGVRAPPRPPAPPRRP